MLTDAQLDRARGVLVGLAAGDALGAPYEFGPARGPELPIEMTGGGGLNWEAGEWTDDTSMAIVIAQVAADCVDLLSTTAQDRIVTAWANWALSAPDVGIQTREVLSVARSTPPVTAAAVIEASRQQHARTGKTAGNGSLMRTSPVALAYLDDEDGLVQAAGDLSKLTHFDDSAAEACVLWCLAIRHAVLTGELDVRGWDTDTVAAIAGSLVGAASGAAQVPAEWTELLHGWPGLDADALATLATAIVAHHP